MSHPSCRGSMDRSGRRGRWECIAPGQLVQLSHRNRRVPGYESCSPNNVFNSWGAYDEGNTLCYGCTLCSLLPSSVISLCYINIHIVVRGSAILVHKHAYMQTYMHTYMQTYIHISIYIYTYIHTCTHTDRHKYIQSYNHTDIHTLHPPRKTVW